MKIEIKESLDKILVDFFPEDGVWKSNCFELAKTVTEENLPCHLRDDNWLADLILEKYDLYPLGKEKIMEYLMNSEHFNKLRYEYEQKIVSWQIDWMMNDGDNWIGDDLFIFSPNCDYAFRKGIVDTLSAIRMNIDAIEEGIERNADKWREKYMRIAFHNIYSRHRFSLHGSDTSKLKEPSQEHYENWRKLRLYEYYMEHKDSVDKYGEVLPEMKMTEIEVTKLKKWLEEAHKERMKKIEEYEGKADSSCVPKMEEIDYYGCDIAPVQEIEKLKYPEESNLKRDSKFKMLIKKIFRN